MKGRYTQDFIETLKRTIFLYENDKIELKKIDFKIIKSIYNCLQDIISFRVEYDYSKYELYKEKMTKDINDLLLTSSFEFDFKGYTKEYLVSESLEYPIPFILIAIKKENPFFDDLSKAIGEKIDGDLVFLIKRNIDNWDLPINGLVIKETKAEEISIFSSLDYKMALTKTEEVLNNAKMFQKNELYNLYKDFCSICFSPLETVKVSQNGLIYPTSFLCTNKEKQKMKSMNEIEGNDDKLFYYNLLYENSISLK